MKTEIKKMAEKCAECTMECGEFCTNYCRDCRYMEMDNNQYNDGTRRCSYKGRWLYPSTEACPYFQP